MELTFSVVVPTYRPGGAWKRWLEAFDGQTVKPQQAILIDSSSLDQTVELAEQFGFQTIQIPKEEFEHGRTRMLGVEACRDTEIVLLLTQDAELASSSSVENLLRPFQDPKVGAVYGRQLPIPGANPIAAHARLFSYPSISSVRARQDIPAFGMRVARFSNSFGAYRLSALLEAGGFPAGVIFGEDQYVVARMVLNGWKVAYEAGAQVLHSHDYTPLQDFRRYFDIGVSHKNAFWMLREFGGATGEGARYVRSQLNYLRRVSPMLIPSAILRTILMLCAYRLGLQSSRLPRSVNRILSMNKCFWDSR